MSCPAADILDMHLYKHPIALLSRLLPSLPFRPSRYSASHRPLSASSHLSSFLLSGPKDVSFQAKREDRIVRGRKARNTPR
jgi:hypothetical protein